MVIEQEYQLQHIKLSALSSIKAQKEFNNGKPIVLALHGWLDNAASFTELFDRAPSWPWCAIDFSGHGNSEHRPQGCFYHLWDYALDVVQLIEELDTEVHLIGHSMGGAVAMLVASVVPEKVTKLVLLDNVGPFTVNAEDRVSRLQSAISSMNKIQNKKKRAYDNQEDMIAARMRGFTPLSERASQRLVHRGSTKASSSNTYQWKHDPKLELTTPFAMDINSVEAFMSKVECPTLLLLAKSGIYKNNENLVNKRVLCFPNRNVKWLEGGHHFHLEEETSSVVFEEIKHFIDYV